MANNASIAGHVTVGDYANFGGYSGVPQFRQIGAHTHIAGMSLVLKDVPAFVTVSGNPASAVGLNIEGMKRRGYQKNSIQALRNAYRLVYRRELLLKDALAALAATRESEPEVDMFVSSIESSTVGIIRGRSASRE
jgi:UDP-N-acetylglucosamine acyltransferase